MALVIFENIRRHYLLQEWTLSHKGFTSHHTKPNFESDIIAWVWLTLHEVGKENQIYLKLPKYCFAELLGSKNNTEM